MPPALDYHWLHQFSAPARFRTYPVHCRTFKLLRLLDTLTLRMAVPSSKEQGHSCPYQLDVGADNNTTPGCMLKSSDRLFGLASLRDAPHQHGFEGCRRAQPLAIRFHRIRDGHS